MRHLISFAAMLLVLALSYGLDRVFEFLRQENSRTFQTALLFWRASLLDLVFAVSILALAWFFLLKSEKSVVLSAVFVIVGLFLVYFSPLWALFPTLPLGFVLGRFIDLFFLSPTAYEYHAAAFIAVLGAIGLLRSAAGFRTGTLARPRASNT